MCNPFSNIYPIPSTLVTYSNQMFSGKMTRNTIIPGAGSFKQRWLVDP